jgi:glutaredoxin 3
MKKIIMYTSNFCPYCNNAEKLLSEKGVDNIDKIKVDEDRNILEEMIQKTGKRTVPQIFIGNNYIGGFEDLRECDQSGELDKLLLD